MNTFSAFLIVFSAIVIAVLLIRRNPNKNSIQPNQIDFFAKAAASVEADRKIVKPIKASVSRKVINVDEIQDDSESNEIDYNYEIVGESFQRDHLLALVRSHKAFATGEINTTATLELEPTNEFDSTAVKVVIEGAPVGHIAKFDSPKVTQMIKKSGKSPYEVPAQIGFDPNSPQPFIGVRIVLTVE
jgi:hypothetical protein